MRAAPPSKDPRDGPIRPGREAAGGIGGIQPVGWLGLLGALVLVALVFLADLQTPLGMAVWIWCVPVCLGALWFAGFRAAAALTALCSLLILAGRFTELGQVSFEWGLVNRISAVAALWIAVLAGRAHQRRSLELASRAESLSASRSFLAATLDPLIVIDDAGIVREASDSVRRVFGYGPEALIGQNVKALMPEPHRSAHDDYLRRYFLTGVTNILGNTRRLEGVRKDGSVFPLDLSVSLVPRLHGRPWFTGILRDVTAQVETERERAFLLESERSARLEAEHATRAKDEFLAMLSHELRTPLNAALGWVQILRRGGQDEATLAQGLEAIERSTRAQAQLIGDMLDMSRILSGKLQLEGRPLDFVSVVSSAVDTVRPGADTKGVVLEYVPGPAGLTVHGDPRRIQQVIWNLLTNAIKFTPSGGRVRVSLAETEGCAQVEVADTGQGIRPDFLPFVFERFRQADSSITRTHGGLGLGLAIVKHIVGLHGGSVEVSSPGEGRGATFTLRLPIDGAVPPRTEREPAPEHFQDPDLSSLRILVVDDDAETCAMLRRMLTECRAEVETAESAATGLERLASFRPDVIVSDLSMPAMDGFQFLREMRRYEGPWGTRPAIALSALARPEDRRRAQEAGFDLHLSKPVDRRELLDAVYRLAGVGSRLRRKIGEAEHGPDPGGRG